MRVLVTGGAGFIGSHLVERLAEQGHRVRVLDDLSTGRRANLNGAPAVELVQGDLRERDQVRRATEGVEAVFHVAARPSVARSWADPVGTLAVNGQGTVNVVAAAAEAGVKTLVYSSSSSVYGEQAGLRMVETMEPRPISPYGFSKLFGEQYALAHGGVNGLRVVALRYFNVFGPRQDPDSPYSAVIPIFIRCALEGTQASIHGDGRQSRDFTYVANVVDANLAALAGRQEGTLVNVACGGSHSLLDLVKAISRLSGSPLRVRHDQSREGDIRHSQADVGSARRLLGFEPRVGFEEGLELTFAHLRNAHRG